MEEQVQALAELGEAVVELVCRVHLATGRFLNAIGIDPSELTSVNNDADAVPSDGARSASPGEFRPEPPRGV
jgi:hypothetical protein